MNTLVVTNFGGPLTRKSDGDIDSGRAKFDTSWGYDPYTKPGNLTWFEQPTSVLTGTSLLGAFVTMKQHVENPFSYMYLVSGEGNVRKINIPSDVASVVGAFPVTPDASNGADLVFYGTTEKIFYGDDNGIQKINIDGSGAASIVGTGSVTTATPRPMITFLGKVYFGNGNNIGEIDTTEKITTGTKLSPGLPTGVVVRDLDVTPDGNYLVITAMRYSPTGGYINPNTAVNAGIESYKFLWNGVDSNYTSYEMSAGVGLTASTSFNNKNYSIGYDPRGTAIIDGSETAFSLSSNQSPFWPTVFSFGNMLGIGTIEFEKSSNTTKASLYNYGQYDAEVPNGLFRVLRLSPSIQPDMVTFQSCADASNVLRVAPFIISNTIVREGKMYLTTTEADALNTNNLVSHLWKFTTAPVGLGSAIAGVYETQTQLFSKKVLVKELRLYTEPLIANNDFTIDLIGSGGSVISGSSKRFTTVGSSTIAIGADMMQYNPQVAPTYALGVRITNASVTGTANWTATKLELDYDDGGK